VLLGRQHARPARRPAHEEGSEKGAWVEERSDGGRGRDPGARRRGGAELGGRDAQRTAGRGGGSAVQGREIRADAGAGGYACRRI